MTYDELLEAVNSPTYRQSRTLEHPYIALRAVVELHTGFSTGKCTDPECCSSGPDYLCNECQEDYPCPTIQAIEKELQ